MARIEPKQPAIYKFAEFELHLADGELRTSQSSVRLQDKPLHLLITLLDHPQRVVTREQLRDRMWDTRTVVNFEQGINVAMRKVRDALGDDAENPRFIETIAKKGYRFQVPVEVVFAGADQPQVANLATPGAPAPVLPSHTPWLWQRRRSLFLAAAVFAIVIAIGGTGFVMFKAKLGRQRSEQHFASLAVLPLQNLSPDAEQDYLADGITEELITGLAQTLPLRVISRTSIMQYKRTDKPLRQIAQELGVDAIVEGSVARAGNQVRVTVQLIDPAEDRHLWAEEYERRTQDLLAMEDELAHAIATRVSNTLNPEQPMRMAARSVDPQVYDWCLMGRYHWNKRTVTDFNLARGYFQQALTRDPNYAPAYAGLAEVDALLPSYAPIPYEDYFSRASDEAQHALQLDANLAEAHTILGFIYLNHVAQWAQSDAEFKRALQIDPNLADAHHWVAYLLIFQGRRDEAVAEISAAQQLDPMSAITNADAGHFLYAAGQFDKARARLERSVELAPELGRPHTTLALIDLETGHPAAAAREARVGLQLDPNNPRIMGEAGYVLAVTGDVAKAKQLLSRLVDLAQQGASAFDHPAMVAVGLGQLDQAVELLKHKLALSSGPGLHSLGQWHAFESLQSNAQYKRLASQTATPN